VNCVAIPMRIAIFLISSASVGITALTAQESPPSSAPSERRLDAPQFLAGEARAAFLKEIEARMSKVASFVATFEQEKSLAIFKKPVHTTGFLLFQSPGGMRWEVSQPFRSILIVDDDKVAKFEFTAGRRRSLNLGRGADPLLALMAQVRRWFSGAFQSDAADFNLQVAEKPSPLILLTSRSKAAGPGIESIRMSLTPELDAVTRVVLRERSGDSTIVSYKTVAKNLTFADDVFSTVDPVDFDVQMLAPATAPDSRKK
jgi:outer membrane lipoprotein-sorting protein